MQLLSKNVERFRGGIIFKAHRLGKGEISLNSRLERNTETEEERNADVSHPAEIVPEQTKKRQPGTDRALRVYLTRNLFLSLSLSFSLSLSSSLSLPLSLSSSLSLSLSRSLSLSLSFLSLSPHSLSPIARYR